MATNLSTYCRQRRLQLGLRPGNVARRMGYVSIAGAANKIVLFEERGDIRSDLFNKLKTALEIQDDMVQGLIQEDQRQFLEEWWKWASKPVPWLVCRKDLPSFVPPWLVPNEITTEEGAEVWASQFATEHNATVDLHLSRRIIVSFNREGQVLGRHEASAGEILLPYLRLSGGSTKFHFAVGADTLSVETVDAPEQHGPSS